MLAPLKSLDSFFHFDEEFDVDLTGTLNVANGSLLTRGVVRLDTPYLDPAHGIEKEEKHIVIERCSVGHEKLPQERFGFKECKVRISRAGWIKVDKYLVALHVEQIK